MASKAFSCTSWNSVWCGSPGGRAYRTQHFLINTKLLLEEEEVRDLHPHFLRPGLPVSNVNMSALGVTPTKGPHDYGV